MEKLEKKGKHDHNFTKLLKVSIFAIIMLAPFFAVLTQCCFAVFNEQSTTTYTGNIQNVFYESVSNISNQTLFSWTTNTMMYTSINTMTTGLGITETTIAVLLTYWALNTCIYIVFDIVIELFTRITHFING